MPAAPAPSTTTFSISSRQVDGVLDGRSGTVTTSATRASTIGAGQRRRGSRTAMPSAIVGPPTPAAGDAGHRRPRLGLHADHLDVAAPWRRRRLRCRRADRRRRRGRRSRRGRGGRRAARGRRCPAPAIDQRVVERVHEGGAGLDELPAPGHRLGEVGPVQRRPWRRGAACGRPSRTASPSGITIVAGMPSSAAWRATAWAWLPADTATTPAARSSAAQGEQAVAGAALLEATTVNWRFSNFTTTVQPRISDSVSRHRRRRPDDGPLDGGGRRLDVVDGDGEVGQVGHRRGAWAASSGVGDRVGDDPGEPRHVE